MNPRILPLLLAAAALLFAAGCQTVESRIRERPEAWAGLDQATKDKIRQGIIDLGYTEDMVYLALGQPDQKRDTRNAAGSSAVWIYNTYYTRYEGTQMMGYHRSVYFDPYLRMYRVHYRPVFADTYSEEKEERIRITFSGGKVTAIEQAKDR